MEMLKPKYITERNKLMYDLETVIGIWEEELNNYSDKEFCTVTFASHWTIGQLYNHLIIETRFLNLKKINETLKLQPDRNSSKNLYGQLLFFIGTMPPYKFKIKGLKPNAIKQPSSVEETKFHLKQLKRSIQEVATNSKLMHTSKTRHPFLGYLNAIEWLELIEIHFRHHLRQKAKIDQALGKIEAKTNYDYLRLLKGKIQPAKYWVEQTFLVATSFFRLRNIAVSFASLFILANILMCEPNFCMLKWSNCSELKVKIQKKCSWNFASKPFYRFLKAESVILVETSVKAIQTRQSVSVIL